MNSDGRSRASTTKLQELIELAQEPSSDRRRELLREVTDLFLITPTDRGPAEMALFDEVLTRLSAEMEVEVQAELAARMAETERPPRALVRRLAGAPIAVAKPLLAGSKALSQEDLLHVAATQGQEHLQVISDREDLSHAVSDLIVKRGDDSTLNVLLGNPKAELSRHASEAIVDRAAENPALHGAVVASRTLPIDLLNEMYFVVEARLRQAIIARNQSLDPATLEAALESGRKRLATRDGALPADYAEAEAHVRKLKRSNAMTPTALIDFLRRNERSRFLVALCELSEIDFHTARRIVERKDLDALAIVCKAAGFERSLFLTLAVLILDADERMERAAEYGRLFGDLPKEAALRTMRFWRVRRTAGDVAAA